MFSDVIEFIRTIYPRSRQIALHEPSLNDRDVASVTDAMATGFVSSVGEYVDRFERQFADMAKSSHAIATVNGTAALHSALLVAGVSPGDEVLTQSLTFVATCNAIAYTQARPVFIDVDDESLGLCPEQLLKFLEQNAKLDQNVCRNRRTGAVIRACLPMHVFGHGCRARDLARICHEWRLSLIEDSAEAAGSMRFGKYLGTFGEMGAFSFNGNKIITTGGGGMLVTDDDRLARRAKHLTTTARVIQNTDWEYVHDTTGFNYRLPNLNAALGCTQLSKLDQLVASKRELADKYRNFFSNRPEIFIDEPADAKSNFWLNCIILTDRETRDRFLRQTNAAGIATRPVWRPMHQLPMFEKMQRQSLRVTEYMAQRVACLPSSPPSHID